MTRGGRRRLRQACRFERSLRCLALAGASCACALVGVLVAPGAALADRSYAEGVHDLFGSFTVLRLSDDGTRLRFLSTHLNICTAKSLSLDDTIDVIPRMPAALRDGEAILVAGAVEHGRLDGELRQETAFGDGTRTLTGHLRLSSITDRGLRGTWTVAARWRPLSGRPQRCTARIPFEAGQGWHVGQSSDQQPVAVSPFDDSVSSVFAFRADCHGALAGSYARGLYAFPMTLEKNGVFGAPVPIDFVGALLDMHPAKVLARGRISGSRASGAFSLSVDWDGSPCRSGRQRWHALAG